MRKSALIILLVCLCGAAYADLAPPETIFVLLFGSVVLLVTATAFALVATLCVELVTSFVYIHLKKLNTRILLSVIVANIISLPLLWAFVLVVALVSSRSGYFLPALLFGEFVVFAFEAVVIFLLNRKRIKKSDAVAMSLVNNLTSFLAGAALAWLVGFAH